MPPPLDKNTFRTIVENTPLVAIDLIVTTPQCEVLLGLRRNQPAQNFWFDPGGRIRKGETIAEAFQRVTREELGSPFNLDSAQFLGVYDNIYPDNTFGESGYGTHYVVLAYHIRVPGRLDNLPADQHDQYRWQPLAEAVADPGVHPYSKMMLQPILDSD